MNTSRRITTGLAALGLIGGLATLSAAPAQASAAPARTAAGAACHLENGGTVKLMMTRLGPRPSGGTVFTKPSTSMTTCHDLNLYNAPAGRYTGYLENANGSWTRCAAGDVTYQKPYVVLCTDVLPGTRMVVVSTSGDPNIPITIMD